VPGIFSTASSLQEIGNDSPIEYFKPKSDEDYLVRVQGRELRKSRRHEGLINEYVSWLSARGLMCASPHPIDLVVTRPDGSWIVEAKVLYRGNATDAVRAAIGQLFAYRHFHYRGEQVQLLALFSEGIGPAYIQFLESCGVAVAWKEEGRWKGSSLACSAELCEEGTS
jgi:hypothetical protein